MPKRRSPGVNNWIANHRRGGGRIFSLASPAASR